MRYVLIAVATLVTGFVGGMPGWWVGVAMDRFRWLRLGPEELTNRPEKVWAWGFIIGGLIGMAAALVVSIWWSRRTTRSLSRT